ncbi:hypothetical protein CCHL11_06020 [Colletotrichum chlorophyti]|uniref:Uncharacterized protein n=1 Tax=Colletotrichum chlorophyti TaxID=708187 RepID=A0A1Q8RWM7_9PEZI|nr:hypothetical protein CCHL11_06020 [Colletotrichum chlorophyti]
MVVTEVGCAGVKPDHKIMDESTPEGKIFLGTYKNIINSPGGPRRIYLSQELNNPLLFWGFFDWDSLEHHENFAKTSLGPEVLKDLPAVLSHGIFTKHIDSTPSLPKALTSPLTDVAVAYFPPETSPEDKSVATAQLQKLLGEYFGDSPEINAIGHSWGLENDFPFDSGKGELNGSILMALVGWSSVEACREFHSTGDYEYFLGSARDITGLLRLDDLQLSCTVLEK